MRFSITSSTTRSREPGEQRDAFCQRRLEGDLAAHGALGDGSDAGLLADEIRELVEAFLADHGGIHVGEEQPLAPSRRRLHDDVDRHVADDSRSRCAVTRSSLPAAGVKGMSTAIAGRKPMRRAAAERVARRAPRALRIRQVTAGDQGGDVRHDGASTASAWHAD